MLLEYVKRTNEYSEYNANERTNERKKRYKHAFKFEFIFNKRKKFLEFLYVD